MDAAERRSRARARLAVKWDRRGGGGGGGEKARRECEEKRRNGGKRVVERRETGEKKSRRAREREKVASLESEEVDGQALEEAGENGVREGGSWMFERTQFA